MGTGQRRFGAVYQRADDVARDVRRALTGDHGDSFASEYGPGLYRRYPASQSRS